MIYVVTYWSSYCCKKGFPFKYYCKIISCFIQLPAFVFFFVVIFVLASFLLLVNIPYIFSLSASPFYLSAFLSSSYLPLLFLLQSHCSFYDCIQIFITTLVFHNYRCISYFWKCCDRGMGFTKKKTNENEWKCLK